LGFVFGMIFGHAPIILPAVLGIPLAYRPTFYVPLLLLEASVALRVTGGLLGHFAARQWGGLLNVVAILTFLGVVAASVVTARRGGSDMASFSRREATRPG
jgi:hypothetical protein